MTIITIDFWNGQDLLNAEKVRLINSFYTFFFRLTSIIPNETSINNDTAKRICGVYGIEIYLIEKIPIKPKTASFRKIPSNNNFNPVVTGLVILNTLVAKI